MMTICCFGQAREGRWDGIVGKKVLNHQGATLGYVQDSVIDLEHGRYVGMLVVYGGFLGIGQQAKVVPPGALSDRGVPRTLFLDMDEATFRNAPTFKMSPKVGPPLVADVAKVYEYFGQQPYFTTRVESSPTAGHKHEHPSYIQRGTKITYLPVENLQGRALGTVIGFRDLNRKSGRLGGVIIRPTGFGYEAGGDKIVEPQILHYNLKRNRLRIDTYDQAFSDSPRFTFAGGNAVFEDHPSRPGQRRMPVVQGTSERDKQVTTQIRNGVLQDGSLTHYARNIQIGTVNGKTIVRGRVETERDRQRIVALAVKAAGPGNVTDLLHAQVMSARENASDTPADPR